jgi:hypothetical protein
VGARAIRALQFVMKPDYASRMISKRAAKWCVPPIGCVLAYLLAFVAASYGRGVFLAVHVPLELIIVSSWIASIVFVARSFPRPRDHALRLPLFLNAAVLGVLAVMLLLALFHS